MKSGLKIKVSRLLRKLGVLLISDKLRFMHLHLKKLRERRHFIAQNPDISIPPAYLIYESFDLNYDSYYFASRKTASWLLDHFRKYIDLSNINILDWGCGPARIVRHLPDLLDPSCGIYATDYNPGSIEWNRKHIKGVNFNLNAISPPLPYVNDSFNVIYGISIFTHLPEELHFSWFHELIRISKNNGILFLTLHGKSFKIKLTDDENKKFDSGALIIRGNTKAGHRTFTSFHPPDFVHRLVEGHQVVEHIEGEVINNKPQQDIWIIRVTK